MSFILGSRWWCWRYHLFSFPPHVPAPPGAIQGECEKGFVFVFVFVCVSGIDKLRGLLAAQFFCSHSGKDIFATKSTVFQRVATKQPQALMLTLHYLMHHCNLCQPTIITSSVLKIIFHKYYQPRNTDRRAL